MTELGAKVSQQDEVRFNGNIIRNERKVYIVMNKPKGFVTSLESTKSQHLQTAPALAATITWPAMFRAIRFRGRAERVGETEIDR